MEQLTLSDLNESYGINWLEFGAGVLVGGATIAADIFVPEASPWITRIGVSASAYLIVHGAISK